MDTSNLSCIVAVPAEGQPILDVGEEKKHVTLAFLGDHEFNVEGAKQAVEAIGATMQPFEASTSGTATLGPDKASVVLVEHPTFEVLRSRVLDNADIREAAEEAENHPHYVPHMTLGYEGDEDPGDLPPTIAFTHIALWVGDDWYTYPLGESMTEKQPGTESVEAAVDIPVPTNDAIPAGESAPEARQWHGIITVEGVPTGDGRMFEPGSLTTRSLSDRFLPLTYQRVTDDGHKAAVTIATIEGLARDAAGNVWGWGTFLNTFDADEVIALIEAFKRFGVSIDADASDGFWDEENEVLRFTSARAAGACVVTIPAFSQAFVAMGPIPDDVGDLVPLEEGNVTLGVEVETEEALVAAGHRNGFPAAWFSDPGLTEPTGVVITDEGRVFGHIATWGTCHIGFDGVCITPPSSNSEYAFFLTGQVQTDIGMVRCGTLTVGGGHADVNLPLRAAVEHYDSTSSVWAYVTVGEDAHGIWFSGALKPGLSEEKVMEVRASGRLSGDGRWVGDSMEMCAALSVNVPGFPVPAPAFSMHGDQQVSLVASGIVPTGEREAKPVSTKTDEKRIERLTVLRTDPLITQSRASRLAALRSIDLMGASDGV